MSKSDNHYSSFALNPAAVAFFETSFGTHARLNSLENIAHYDCSATKCLAEQYEGRSRGPVPAFNSLDSAGNFYEEAVITFKDVLQGSDWLHTDQATTFQQLAPSVAAKELAEEGKRWNISQEDVLRVLEIQRPRDSSDHKRRRPRPEAFAGWLLALAYLRSKGFKGALPASNMETVDILDELKDRLIRATQPMRSARKCDIIQRKKVEEDRRRRISDGSFLVARKRDWTEQKQAAE